MAQIFAPNIYSINNVDLYAGPQQWGFNPQNVLFRPQIGVVTSYGGVRLYGIIQSVPRGLVVDGTQYGTVETVAQLQALANA